MFFLSSFAFILLIIFSAITCWGLFSKPNDLPSWTHKHDKIWHTLAFAGLAFLAKVAWISAAAWLIWLILTVIGLISEVIQEKIAVGRRFSWGDALANTLGAAFGVALSAVIGNHFFLATV